MQEILNFTFRPLKNIFQMVELHRLGQSHSRSVCSPWPAVRKRELWEQPFWNNRILPIQFHYAVSDFLHLWCAPEMVVPRAQVFWLLVKGNKDSGDEIVIGLYRYSMCHRIGSLLCRCSLGLSCNLPPPQTSETNSTFLSLCSFRSAEDHIKPVNNFCL